MSSCIAWCPADFCSVATKAQHQNATKVWKNVARITALIWSISVKLNSQSFTHAAIYFSNKNFCHLPDFSHCWAGDLEPAHVSVGPCHMPVQRPHQFGPHQLHLSCEEVWEVFRQHLQDHSAQDLGGTKRMNRLGYIYGLYKTCLLHFFIKLFLDNDILLLSHFYFHLLTEWAAWGHLWGFHFKPKRAQCLHAHMKMGANRCANIQPYIFEK